MTLPSVFPIFPLDQVILVPGTLLPLHVFEPRYREMVTDALDGERVVAMAMPWPIGVAGDDPPVHPVCGLGRIVHHQPYVDGRSDIILEGLARMRIEQELPSDKLYRIVRGVPLEETPPTEDVSERTDRLLARGGYFAEDERLLLVELPLGQALDSLLVRLPLAIAYKQEIFATPDLGDRLTRLEEALDDLEGPSRAITIEPEDPRLN